MRATHLATLGLSLMILPATAAAQPVLLAGTDTTSQLLRTVAWLGVVLLLGFGVLINASDQLQRITRTLHEDFATNVRIGVIAQLAAMPVLAVICLLLALTLLGALLVPFAIVGYLIAVLGLAVLGGLGAAQMVGAALSFRTAGKTARAVQLQCLMLGLVVLWLPWLASTLLRGVPIGATLFRVLGVGLAWAAVTAGLGAALRTRGGTRSADEPWRFRRMAPSGTPLPVEPPKPEWMTPTPLTGVVAVSRRSTTTTTGGTGT
jgi:hypothetical protein